ncbi:hypothetical protein [Magnetospirillum sulfuroxidans]|uniref:Uncharacterized protein n=1 Tax=Magnetospirillum sulfuroxidans TaxID=611300 RepID=A0ABS5IAT2_9PROT|nr:hypothetical protein [Magnetospirillum sulfuroxidans]MBR9971537.1 hypothetical protein [Magnetospirillum sulfuroxidans]
MLFVLIDRFLDPLSPVPSPRGDAWDDDDGGMRPMADRLVCQYYDNAWSRKQNPRDEEEQC